MSLIFSTLPEGQAAADAVPNAFAGADPALFREAMSRVAGAVHLITTDGPAGKAGMTATALASVAAEPPSLLVCLAASSGTALMLRSNGRFAVSTLAAGQQELAQVFAGRTAARGLARFDHGRWETGPDGQPVLSDALLAFCLKVGEIRPVATHLVVFGEITAIGLGQAHAGLVYTRRAYHAV